MSFQLQLLYSKSSGLPDLVRTRPADEHGGGNSPDWVSSLKPQKITVLDQRRFQERSWILIDKNGEKVNLIK